MTPFTPIFSQEMDQGKLIAAQKKNARSILRNRSVFGEISRAGKTNCVRNCKKKKKKKEKEKKMDIENFIIAAL